MLDETGPEMSDTQLSWLEGELQAAKSADEPAIAIGVRGPRSPDPCRTQTVRTLAKILVTGSVGVPAGHLRTASPEHARGETACSSASAYFYDSREENEHKPLRAGGEAIEAYGSGTLGYVNTINQLAGNFHGASGLMLAQVNTASRDPATNRAEVQVPLTPVIGELALEALQGTLLQRSHPALFAGLARRPRAGCDAEGQQSRCEVAPYIPIPSICTGTCGTAVLPEYGFKSSDPEIGAFVKRNLGSNEQLAVLQNAEGRPILESESGSGAKSGLFCAFNPGTTTVTITAGGWSASLPVTVQRGSVREPCGTVKLSNPPAEGSASIVPAPPLNPTPATAPAGSPSPVSFPPPPPPAPGPLATPAQVGVAPFFVAAAPTAPVLAAVPPPVPTPARPSPPSGTSAVTSPVEAVEKEEEHEEAPESVSNQAVAYHPKRRRIPAALPRRGRADLRPRWRGLRTTPAGAPTGRRARTCDGHDLEGAATPGRPDPSPALSSRTAAVLHIMDTWLARGFGSLVDVTVPREGGGRWRAGRIGREARRLTVMLTLALAGLMAAGVASASAQTTFGGLGRIGALTIKEGAGKGQLELEENDGFAVEAATGDFYVADQTEEPARTRVQKFGPEGKFIAQALIKLPGGEHEVELKAIALDAEKHKLYMLVDGERVSNSKHDSSDTAAAEIFVISTEAQGEELTVTTLLEQKSLEPYSEKAKVSLIEPAGLAIDPTNHDLLISAQQDEDKSEIEELHSVIQRVHENGKFGPRYVDSQNCLDEGAEVAAEPNCFELRGEQPDSMAITQAGRALVEMEQDALWEIPIAAHASEEFKEEKIVPLRRFARPRTHPSRNSPAKKNRPTRSRTSQPPRRKGVSTPPRKSPPAANPRSTGCCS